MNGNGKRRNQMQKQVFNAQMGRVRSQWPNAYGPERELLIWKAFEVCPDKDFIRATEILLSEERGAPLVPQFERAISQAAMERRQQNAQRGLPTGFVSVLETAAKKTTADPEFVKACMQTIHAKLDGRMSHSDFLAQCDLLDRAAKELVRAGKVL
jgi:hypothetical protein